jgi:hypothetical protein
MSSSSFAAIQEATYGITREGFENCTHEQQRQLLDWFFYRLKPEPRIQLAMDLPAAYNAYVGREMVRVVRVENLL